MGLALGVTLKFYSSVAKWSKLKVRNFWGLSPTFVKVTGEKLVVGDFLPPHAPTPPRFFLRVAVTIISKLLVKLGTIVYYRI